MRRARLAQLALCAFPASMRESQGDEMLGTMLDVSTSSRGRFVREVVGLVRSGLQARSLQTARAGALRVVGDGVCLCGVWLLMLSLAGELGNRLRTFDPQGPWHPLSLWSLALLTAALATGLIGHDRLAGAVALVFVATLVADPEWHDLTASRRELLLLPVLCFVVLVLAPRRRRPDYRRLAWLVLAAGLAAVSSATDDPTAAILIFGLLVLVPIALALFKTDPRLAIACSLPAASFGIHMAQDPGGPGLLGLLFLSAAPLILGVTALRTRHLQTSTRI